MNNETSQCILCEKMCIILYENYKYITNFNKNKDIYLENIDTREVTFINFVINVMEMIQLFHVIQFQSIHNKISEKNN